MAGAPAGYRTFAAGEVLTAANVQTYLQDQVVSVYADAAAADAALASPAEGQFRWLSDVDAFQVYSGSAWVNAGGGATGSVVQVVSTTKTDTFSTTSTSFTDVTGLSASITPSSTSSKIIVNVSVSLGGELADGLYPSIFDGSNNNILVPDSPGSRTSAYRGGVFNGTPDLEPAPFTIVHSPNTTSSFTYKVRVRVSGGTGYVNRASSDTDSSARTRGVSTITLMEVAG